MLEDVLLKALVEVSREFPRASRTGKHRSLGSCRSYAGALHHQHHLHRRSDQGGVDMIEPDEGSDKHAREPLQPKCVLHRGARFSPEEVHDAKGVDFIIFLADNRTSKPSLIVVPSSDFINEWRRNGLADVARREAKVLKEERLLSFERDEQNCPASCS